MSADSEALTELLLNWRDGDGSARDRLAALLYQDLRQMARASFRAERPNHTLQPTAMVHELYLRLFQGKPVAWQDRAHFFAVASQTLRRILVDHARAHHAGKRGGERVKVTLSEIQVLGGGCDDNLLAVEEALEELQRLQPRAVQVVELRFFAGLTEEETAAVLELSPITVKRDWKFARAWLLSRLAPSRPQP